MIGRFLRGACWTIAAACCIEHRYSLAAVYVVPLLSYHVWRRVRVVLYDA